MLVRLRTRAVVVVVGLLLAGCGGDGGTSVEATDQSAADLSGTDWRIDAIAAAGERRQVNPSYGATLRFDGDGGFSGQTCGQLTGEVTISDTELAWGGDVDDDGTDCADDALAWVDAALKMVLEGTSSWTHDDGRLVVEGNEVTLELSERPAGFPSQIVQLATSDTSGPSEWQFGYIEATDAEVAAGAYRFFLAWEGRPAPGTAYRAAGTAVEPDTAVEAMWVDDVDGGLFSFGTLPEGTASAVFEGSDGTREDLTIYELPDGQNVYGQNVEATEGQVVALDAAGTEVGRGRTVPAD